METIKIDVGVYTTLKLDLKEYDFTGIEKLILTAKNFAHEEPIIEKEFNESIEYDILITPEESKKLNQYAEYDFDMICTDGKRYKASDIGKIELVKCVGVCDGE